MCIMPNAYPCKTGGAEIFEYYLANELKQYFDINVLTQCKSLGINGISVTTFGNYRIGKITKPLTVLYHIFKTRKSIELLYFSYTRSYWTNWLVYIICNNLLKIKYAFTIHGGGLSKWSPYVIHKKLFDRATFITGVSQRIIDEYTKRSGRQIVYTPPLVPFDVISQKNKYRSDLGVLKDEVVLLYVGSLKPLKSVNTLIDALGLITAAKLKEYRLKVLIAGDGISREYLEAKTKELKVDKFVKFLGIIPRDKINQLYNMADIYTICSEFEGLPISLLEAFANEIPSLTSDAPGLINMSLNNENTLLFKTKDHLDYAKKIELLVNDASLREKLSKNSRFYYENNFSYQSLLSTFTKLIDNVA